MKIKSDIVEKILLGFIAFFLLMCVLVVRDAARAQASTERYQPACTEIHKHSSSPRKCDE